MIKANELRIGNYYTNGIDFYEVIPSVIEKVFESERLWCNPIPLTEEILLKCGAEKSGVGFKISPITIWRSSYTGCFCFRYMNVGESADRHVFIKYLHQLQNLYFALTGEELTVKL